MIEEIDDYAIILLDENGDIINWNKGAEKIMGYTSDEIIGKNFRIFYASHEQQDKLPEELLAKALREGRAYHDGWRLRKDGSSYWGSGVITALYDERKNFMGFSKISRDLTERKLDIDKVHKSEKRYYSIIEQFPHPIVTYSPDGVSTSANLAWEIMWQDKRENAKDYNIRKDPQFIASGLSRYVEKAFGGEVAIAEPFFYDPALIGKIGRPRWIQMVLYPLKGEDGELLEVILILLDITANKEAEEQIKQLNAQLEEKVAKRTEQLQMAIRELESFSYSVSHDLRSPLRAINGYTTLLSRKLANNFDEESHRLMTNILNNTKGMSQLIDDLLEFSKVGKKELIKTPCQMADIVNSVLDEFNDQPNDRNIEWRILESTTVFVDVVTIKQVWLNLISNALKYTKNIKNTVIEIGSKQVNNEIISYIKDNGAGFDMRYIDKLFGVFQRLHSQEEFEGTGVGLAIVHKIITRHGGRVWAEGKINEGAIFYFSLPTII